MADPADIVTRLRAVLHDDRSVELMNREAADEIERLRKECFHLSANQCHAGYGGEYGHHRCAEIDRLTKERDEARREFCQYIQQKSPHGDVLPQHYAEARGWDCFKENTDG